MVKKFILCLIKFIILFITVFIITKISNTKSWSSKSFINCTCQKALKELYYLCNCVTFKIKNYLIPRTMWGSKYYKIKDIRVSMSSIFSENFKQLTATLIRAVISFSISRIRQKLSL